MRRKKGKTPSKLALARFIKGVGQYDLALETGICQTRISLIENNYWEPTTADKNKLAKALDIPVSDLFPKSEEKKNDKNKI